MRNNTSQKKKCKWPISKWKYDQHHKSRRNYKLKPNKKSLHTQRKTKDKQANKTKQKNES